MQETTPLNVGALVGDASQPQQACELCHKAKQKCKYNDGRPPCIRCSKLGTNCIERTRKRMGRPPVAKTAPTGSFTVLDVGSSAPPVKRKAAQSTPTSIPQMLSSSTNYSPRCRNVRYILDSGESFFYFHRHFMLGESFISQYQSAVRLIFDQSPELIADAYVAVTALMTEQGKFSPIADQQSLNIASNCLRYLNEVALPIEKVQDAALVLMLGQLMLLYNTMMPNTFTRSITRGILLITKDWYPSILENSSINEISLCPVLIDTVECLFTREVPVVRVPEMDRHVVDRLLGISSTLLPLLYDLCEISHECKVKPLMNTLEEDPYKDIESRIDAWVPEWPPGFLTKYSPSEVNTMAAQARVYRLATLLIIHRLRYPLGVQDEKGHMLADSILQVLEELATLPTEKATSVGLDFPLLVAMIEKPEWGEQIYEAFEPRRYKERNAVRPKLDVVHYVTGAKNLGYSSLWFDLVQGGCDTFIP